MQRRKYYAAGFMILIGALTVMGSLNYSLGSLARMGPGYFPVLLGATLMLVGVLIMAAPANDEDGQEAQEEQGEASEDAAVSRMTHVRPILLVSMAMLAFILVGRYGGLVPATFILILLSALGDRDNSFKAALILAAGVTAFAVAVFHYGMQIQFPLFSWG